MIEFGNFSNSYNLRYTIFTPTCNSRTRLVLPLNDVIKTQVGSDCSKSVRIPTSLHISQTYIHIVLPSNTSFKHIAPPGETSKWPQYCSLIHVYIHSYTHSHTQAHSVMFKSILPNQALSKSPIKHRVRM